ncbi:DUF3511 domain protein [Quillaja saponaria]|uniref:DUF3511 domain protein n=1 Tax=Quillaja saponaria TaxID=32244 RepID=A0AAD7PQA1_QUISA|nr:DUF3511 domain protein [Quillaja saponaria]
MDFRSKSYKDDRMQIESYSGGKAAATNMQDLRCYSANYTNSSACHNQLSNEVKINKKKRTAGTVSKSRSFNDPELQRKKRVAGYKVYSVDQEHV